LARDELEQTHEKESATHLLHLQPLQQLVRSRRRRPARPPCPGRLGWRRCLLRWPGDVAMSRWLSALALVLRVLLLGLRSIPLLGSRLLLLLLLFMLGIRLWRLLRLPGGGGLVGLRPSPHPPLSLLLAPLPLLLRLLLPPLKRRLRSLRRSSSSSRLPGKSSSSTRLPCWDAARRRRGRHRGRSTGDGPPPAAMLCQLGVKVAEGGRALRVRRLWKEKKIVEARLGNRKKAEWQQTQPVPCAARLKATHTAWFANHRLPSLPSLQWHAVYPASQHFTQPTTSRRNISRKPPPTAAMHRRHMQHVNAWPAPACAPNRGRRAPGRSMAVPPYRCCVSHASASASTRPPSSRTLRGSSSSTPSRTVTPDRASLVPGRSCGAGGRGRAVWGPCVCGVVCGWGRLPQFCCAWFICCEQEVQADLFARPLHRAAPRFLAVSQRCKQPGQPSMLPTENARG
jgi:hypothetical protein